MKKNKNKTPIVYEFDPVIYPRLLWVGIGVDEEFYNQHFEGDNGGKLNFQSNGGYYGVTFDEIVNKETLLKGDLVVFQSKNDMRMGVIAHEASHVVDGIENAIGMEHGDEPSAYLYGRVCKSINLARLGDVEPLKFESTDSDEDSKV